MVNRMLSRRSASCRNPARAKPSFKRGAIICREDIGTRMGGASVQRRVFRIDAMGRSMARAYMQAASRHSALRREIRSLRSAAATTEEVTERMLESYKAQIAEAQKLKSELDLINDAINRTKQELATVHVTGFQGPEMARVTNELDAVIDATENAP